MDRLARANPEVRADAHVVTRLDDIAWLYNVRGSDVPYNPLLIAYALVTREHAWLFVDPGSDPRAAAAFVALGTAVTLQAMAVVGVLWVLVAMAWTTLRSDVVGWALEHPWRSWQGRPTEVAKAWRQGGWLVIELVGQWRRWYVRAARDQEATTDALRRQLSDDAWLSRADARAHLARTVLPAVLAAAGLGGLALLWALRVLDGLMHRP